MTSSFHDTRWTLVSRSRGSDTQAAAALNELCEAYYAPVVAFLRRSGREDDAARELAHDFFAKLLAGGAMDGARPERGKFRSYLLGALKHFAADQRDKKRAEKRGGGVEHAEIDAEHEMADLAAESPDWAFDRQWALTVLARSLSRLEAEMTAEGKDAHFEALKPWLTTDSDSTPQATAAEKLGMSIEAVKVAIHRLRKRFRDSVKAEIGQTVSEAGSVREELDALMSALRK
ncbi:MAG: sigma-70 family RNA polymerase sigma factor [Prosthecobacter sp.]|jgi:RNA polymerase sigma factor (sigma-70 family)|uniref:RNA polymerase sigma factor n=1 Tax=Prosthecobacter sp. TaxID=1965333 RepID=UPI0019E709D9|nr:sigma-70 family RNA polymerase sigma factor [Prosthecobacter sp.]MBE2286144.1 sigma-70 family RNA polymerase sigma factor [Prosthecobacter sp.]